ncbi:hypothetical protein ACFY36_49535 [Actinoplanes sp. NPDC000266]
MTDFAAETDDQGSVTSIGLVIDTNALTYKSAMTFSGHEPFATRGRQRIENYINYSLNQPLSMLQDECQRRRFPDRPHPPRYLT